MSENLPPDQANKFVHASHFNAMSGIVDMVLREAAAYASRAQEIQNHLENQVKIDPLTGLTNRIGFEEDFGRPRGPGSMLYFDLDGFREVNNTHGHTVGDHALMSVADTLRDSFRPTDTVARLGGDEYGVIARNATAEQAAIIGRRVISKVNSIQEIDGRSVRFGVSIGIRAYDIIDSFQVVKDDSDAAMYEAKRAGKNRIVIFGQGEQL